MSIKVEQDSPNYAKISNFALINEDTVFPKIETASLKSVDVDLDALEVLNSVGVRTWIQWVSGFPETCSFSLLNCPRIFMDIASMVMGVIPKNGRFASIKVPYYCEKCDDATTVVIISDINTLPEVQTCTACQGVAELDLSAKTIRQLQKAWK